MPSTMTDLEIRQFFLPQAVILLLAKGRPTPLISSSENNLFYNGETTHPRLRGLDGHQLAKFQTQRTLGAGIDTAGMGGLVAT